jgi:hypothetical protein
MIAIKHISRSIDIEYAQVTKVMDFSGIGAGVLGHPLYLVKHMSKSRNSLHLR